MVYQTPVQSEVSVASSPDDNTFWFITNFDVLYKTSSGGASWDIINNPAFVPFGLFVLDNNIAFKTSYAKVWKTTNGGNFWTTVFSSSGSTPPNVWMKNNTEGVFSFGGSLYKTTDGGNSWSTSLITQPPSQVINSAGKGVLYSYGNNLWAALTNNKIAYSSDFGISWSVAANTGITFTNPPHIFFGSPQFGLCLTGNSPFIYATTNGAASWHTVDNSLGANEDILINNSHCWYIPNPADHFYIKYSQDSGTTWIQQLFDQNGFSILEKSRTGNVLWSGTLHGKIYKYNDLVGINNQHEEIPESYLLEQNYPNPFNPSTKIGFRIMKSGFARLTIFDISGREISVLINNELKSGNYEVNWNAENCSSGIYFYTLKINEFTNTKKMLILK